ncbi:hypothetical protein BCR36DRAFT_339933 [Piromyces finnis]|uniref:Elongation of fatty acids protein n=1 Tax=Piromyces finnis TaxID=1754191 RepID=A0A1Y1UQY1_9FUNG|nr:hypothetical protein BCR36DRAFT_339933 [Piromyces finnis]|eukprot:ORX40362.1 hypothetical protein BCR36DRAFT_339933 [Piromyces finnis]
MVSINDIVPPLNQWEWNQFFNPNNFKWTVNKTPLSGYISVIWLWIIYFSLIAIIKLFMKNKKPFNVDSLTSINNKIFITWSVILTLLSGYSVFDKLLKFKLKELYCENETTIKGLWPYITYIYYLNKIYQLSGSILLTLKKKSLRHYHIWRHVYAIPLTYSWLNNRMIYSTLAVFVNSFVHTFLYIYSWKISKDIKKAPFYKKHIIFFQTFQFVASFTIGIPHLFFYIISRYPNFPWSGSYIHENLICNGMIPFIMTLVGNIFFLIGFIRIHIKDLKVLNKNFYHIYIYYLNEIAPDKLSKNQKKILMKKFNHTSMIQKKGNKKKSNSNNKKNYKPNQGNNEKGAI